MTIEAFDDKGQQCPEGTLGELWMKGPHLFRGYWNRPEATAEALPNGWFKTGDIGWVDEDGFVTIEDRKRHGAPGRENVYCAEVEGALYELPGVSEAIVFGLPHERLGEEVAAVIVAAPGAAFEAEGVRAKLHDLAHFKVPSQLFFRRTRCLATPRGNSSRGRPGGPAGGGSGGRVKGRRGALGLGLALAGALAASLSGCDGGAASGDRAAPYPLPPEPLATSYRRHCQQCHSLGVAGAPAVGDVVAWAPRQAQGLPALLARVEAGFPRPCRPGGCLL